MSGTKTFSVELPTSAIQLILAGEFTAGDYWKHFGDDSHRMLKHALGAGQRISNIEFVPGDALQRVEDRIRVTFGDPVAPVIGVSERQARRTR